jgi:hypothetical protein
MPKVSYAEFFRGWERLSEKVLANKDDLAQLEPYRAQLEAELAGAKEANSRQVFHQAEASQATRDLEGFLGRGNDLAVRINDGIRFTYGNRAEKLKEFGLNPRRPRKNRSAEKSAAKAKGKEKEPAKEKQEEEKPAPSKPTTDAKPQ